MRPRAPSPPAPPPPGGPGCASFSGHDLGQSMEQIDAGVDLVAVDRDALDVDAQGDPIPVAAVEDAAQVVAADLDRPGERACGAEDRALGFRGDVDAEPADEGERLLASAR